MSIRASYRYGCLFLLALGLLLSPACSKDESHEAEAAAPAHATKPVTRAKTGKESAARSGEAELLQAVSLFRLEGLGDYERALTSHADSYVQRKFKEFDQALWPATPPSLGWSFFFNSCLICPGAPREAGTPVAFYHPWSDVFLVTAWKRGSDGKFAMNDAEVLMGDLVRKSGRPPFEPSRLWMREDMYRPVAVGLAAAKTLRAFERIFREGPADGPWRSALPALMDAKVLESNYFGAGALFAENLAEMAPLMDTRARTGDNALLRAGLAEVVDKALAGQASAIAREASATLPESREALAAMTADDWQRLTPVAVISAPTRSVVMLAKADNPDIYLGLLLVKDRGRMRAQRIDLLSFNSFYSIDDSAGRESE